mmetsp:Transcript_52729/g.120158  ORF Transcript_52729/g.120158 Transcript_52729/m.120158 type:complete len:435 (-) Transcript_52729:12-1316(-)
MPISVIMAAALAAVVFPRRMAVGNSDVMVSGKWDNETLFWTPELIAGADLPGVLDPGRRSGWTPVNHHTFPLHHFTPDEAADCLCGLRVLVMGNSYQRNLYVGLSDLVASKLRDDKYLGPNFGPACNPLSPPASCWLDASWQRKRGVAIGFMGRHKRIFWAPPAPDSIYEFPCPESAAADSGGQSEGDLACWTDRGVVAAMRSADVIVASHEMRAYRFTEGRSPPEAAAYFTWLVGRWLDFMEREVTRNGTGPVLVLATPPARRDAEVAAIPAEFQAQERDSEANPVVRFTLLLLAQALARGHHFVDFWHLTEECALPGCHIGGLHVGRFANRMKAQLVLNKVCSPKAAVVPPSKRRKCKPGRVGGFFEPRAASESLVELLPIGAQPTARLHRSAIASAFLVLLALCCTAACFFRSHLRPPPSPEYTRLGVSIK